MQCHKKSDDVNTGERSICAGAMSQTEKEIKAYFDGLDKDGSGKITFAEMKADMQKQYPDLNFDEMIKATIDGFDTDKDGEISWEEYIKFMRDNGGVKEEETEEQKNDS